MLLCFEHVVFSRVDSDGITYICPLGGGPERKNSWKEKDLLSGKDSEMEKGRSGAGEGGKSWMCGQEMSGCVSGHHAPFEWRLQ